MCNYEIKTRCGKYMKHLLYKYHMKKCDICKGKNPSLNLHAVNNMMKNTKGKKVHELTTKDIKNHGYKRGPMEKLSNCVKSDLEPVIKND
jgi:hypothetical protein